VSYNVEGWAGEAIAIGKWVLVLTGVAIAIGVVIGG